MNRWKKILGITVIAIGVAGILFIDSRIIDYTEGKHVKFTDLPQEVKDSLVWWGKNTMSTDTIMMNLKDVICFDSDYTVSYSTFGPWIIARFLKRNSDGKTWKFKGMLNVPTPMVTIGDTLYVPTDYNIANCEGIDDNAVFYQLFLE